MKVAVIADALENQGAGVHVFTLEMIRALWATRGEHQLVLVLGKDNNPLFPNLPKIIIPKRHVLGYSSWRLFYSVPKKLREEEVDLVLEPAHFGPFGLPPSILRATVIHDLTPILFPQLHRWHSQILQRLFLSGILRRANCIIANSLHTQADILKHFPFTAGKTLQIYPGMSDRSEEEEQANVPAISKPYFLMVGTVEPRKNHLLVLAAFEKLQKRSQSKYALVIAGGKGWKSAPIYKALKDHTFKKDIFLMGYVSSKILPSLYSQALALVYPSTYEGFGLPILEAMHYGTLVLTARNSSLVEVGGAHAFYIGNFDAEELYRKMLEVTQIESDQRKMLLVKYKEHIKKFSWKASAEKIWEAFENLEKNRV